MKAGLLEAAKMCRDRADSYRREHPGNYHPSRLLEVDEISEWLEAMARKRADDSAGAEPVPMLLWCPMCHARHIDEGEFATKVHHSHSCQACGLTWRPALVPTVGVQFLPGFKNGGTP